MKASRQRNGNASIVVSTACKTWDDATSASGSQARCAGKFSSE
ncbi:hypothetical protein [Nitrosomonas europaea]|nr:hypothetical protein [Nitrosomonas europaea]